MYKWFFSFVRNCRVANVIFELNDNGFLSKESLEFVEDSLNVGEDYRAVITNFIQMKF